MHRKLAGRGRNTAAAEIGYRSPALDRRLHQDSAPLTSWYEAVDFVAELARHPDVTGLLWRLVDPRGGGTDRVTEVLRIAASEDAGRGVPKLLLPLLAALLRDPGRRGSVRDRPLGMLLQLVCSVAPSHLGISRDLSDTDRVVKRATATQDRNRAP